MFDSRFDGSGPFRDTPEAGGISLESALRDFGPAALDDLIPRLRALAAVLDEAHASGIVHGALHPSKVIVHDDQTSLLAARSHDAHRAKGRERSAHPYVAPEVAGGDEPTAASDRYSLAAIAYEWLFGRPIERPADRPIDVRAMPNVDRGALSKAFSRALSPEPVQRFASCAAFCDALATALVPELPLLALDTPPDDDMDPVGPFIPETPAPDLDDIRIAPETLSLREPVESSEQPRAAASDEWEAPDHVLTDRADGAGGLDAPLPPPVSGSPLSETYMRPHETPQRFGGFALILATIVGAIFGFAAGYMARPRALQSDSPPTIAGAPGTEARISSDAGEARDAGAARDGKPPAPAAASAAPPATGRLLVRSTPSGATVTVDGVEKGATPLALSDVEFGTHDVSVARRGYVTETRKVQIAAARPSRSLDVRLAAASAPLTAKSAGRGAVPRPSTPATLGRPAASTGSLVVESRPAGAAISINGKPSGSTPRTVAELAPGDYRILLTLPGYRSFTTTVRVVAGQRVRAAASLTAQEQE
ncbi:MAG TPA: PEGA domain-containing protein [Vicinamibacterales bacterium]|nr:PEGA domain-containing protein [Vicinamibacterales bacterium]